MAGTLLGERYRIIALLGRGGMGEVYKAEDLKLQQDVALKLLPETFSGDVSMLARLYREVRTARQVTHANICRVHDIGEVSTGSSALHFISMEYIDGEDLAALLRRIGHLPGAKAVELSRQICAGLSAAHAMGVLHRDLKPANIMLDGRGRARITDFGLAGLAEEFRGQKLTGTPAYMAPEQLRGGAATVRTDIYSLGLVLYEIFTGKRVFEGRNIAELIHQHERTAPSSPSSWIKEIDPLVERTILRCLSKEPAKRPESSLEILTALPGGDPLAAVLAAGETPSPEMVAAAGEKIGFRPVLAWTCLIAIAAVCMAVAWPLNPARDRSPTLDQSPEVLAHRAREIIAGLGYPEPPVDSAYAFVLDDRIVEYERHGRSIADFEAQLARDRPGWLRFSYRESSGMLPPGSAHQIGPIYARPGMQALPADSQQETRGIVDVTLDPQGNLLEFRTSRLAENGKPVASPDWNALLSAAGVAPSDVTPAEPETAPPVASDAQVAWTGTWPGRPEIPLRVEAAAWRGKPVSFQVRGPWSSGVPMQERKIFQLRVLEGIKVAFVTLIMGVAVFSAWYNVRLGRGDGRGAFRLALFSFSVLMASWYFGTEHRLDSSELNLYLSAIGECLYWSVSAALMYLAVEPLVRRRWPHALISWNRVVAGRFSDPLVGRHVLTGVVFAAGLSLVRTATLLVGIMSPMLPEPDLLDALRGNSHAVSFLLALAFDSVHIPLALFFLFSFVRIVLRSAWAAALVLIVLVDTFVSLPNPELSSILIGTVFCVLWLLAVTRFGLICGMSMWFADRVFRAEIMLAPNAWYTDQLYLVLGTVLALSVYAFVTSRGGKPLFSPRILDPQS